MRTAVINVLKGNKCVFLYRKKKLKFYVSYVPTYIIIHNNNSNNNNNNNNNNSSKGGQRYPSDKSQTSG